MLEAGFAASTDVLVGRVGDPAPRAGEVEESGSSPV